jgi:hypothetical protein
MPWQDLGLGGKFAQRTHVRELFIVLSICVGSLIGARKVCDSLIAGRG